MGSSFAASVSNDVDRSEHWLSPAFLLAHLNLRSGMTVADIGAGSGCYTFPIGLHVGPAGRVFAVEWRPWLLEHLRARLSRPAAPENVSIVEGRACDTHLPESSCDLVLLADIWHQLEQCNTVLDEARRILRREGRLAILNWRPDGLCPPGPPVEHRVSLRRTLCAVELKSWSLVHTAEGAQDGYMLVFEPTDESVQS